MARLATPLCTLLRAWLRHSPIAIGLWLRQLVRPYAAIFQYKYDMLNHQTIMCKCLTSECISATIYKKDHLI